MARGKKKTTKKKTGKALVTKKAGAIAIPIDMEAQLAALAAEQAELEAAGTGKTIKLKDSGFEFNGEKMDNPFEGTVLDYVFENAYYPGPYVEGEASTPACFAIGRIEADMMPHPSSPDIQAKTCADCWANEYESNPNGGKGKACSNKRRLAILPIPEEGDLTEVEPAIMRVSPTSLANWKGFVKKVVETMRKPLLRVICEFSREDKVTDFTYIDDLDDIDVAACLEHKAAVKAELEAPFDVSNYKPEGKKGERIKVKKAPAKKASKKKASRRRAA